MKRLTPAEREHLLSRLAERYELRLPILLPDGTRTIGSPDDGPLALLGGAVPGKPTAAFFPQQEAIFTADHSTFSQSPPPVKPLCILGFTPADLHCLRFIDRFFADGFRDDLYFRLRQRAVVAGISGYCGTGGALLPPAGGNCDFELFWSGEIWLVTAYGEIGTELVAELPDCTTAEEELVARSITTEPDSGAILLQTASQLLRTDRVPDTFWEEIGERCIACTGCNLACPTCTCFGVLDWRSATTVERSRTWDSCQLDGFMREASGHNPLGSEALRSRRRIHHKLAADPRKWGEISCFRCGRCDATCPTGIGIMAVARELVARFGCRLLVPGLGARDSIPM